MIKDQQISMRETSLSLKISQSKGKIEQPLLIPMNQLNNSGSSLEAISPLNNQQQQQLKKFISSKQYQHPLFPKVQGDNYHIRQATTTVTTNNNIYQKVLKKSVDSLNSQSLSQILNPLTFNDQHLQYGITGRKLIPHSDDLKDFKQRLGIATSSEPKSNANYQNMTSSATNLYNPQLISNKNNIRICNNNYLNNSPKSMSEIKNNLNPFMNRSSNFSNGMKSSLRVHTACGTNLSQSEVIINGGLSWVQASPSALSPCSNFTKKRLALEKPFTQTYFASQSQQQQQQINNSNNNNHKVITLPDTFDTDSDEPNSLQQKEQKQQQKQKQDEQQQQSYVEEDLKIEIEKKQQQIEEQQTMLGQLKEENDEQKAEINRLLQQIKIISTSNQIHDHAQPVLSQQDSITEQQESQKQMHKQLNDLKEENEQLKEYHIQLQLLQTQKLEAKEKDKQSLELKIKLLKEQKNKIETDLMECKKTYEDLLKRVKQMKNSEMWMNAKKESRNEFSVIKTETVQNMESLNWERLLTIETHSNQITQLSKQLQQQQSTNQTLQDQIVTTNQQILWIKKQANFLIQQSGHYDGLIEEISAIKKILDAVSKDNLSSIDQEGLIQSTKMKKVVENLEKSNTEFTQIIQKIISSEEKAKKMIDQIPIFKHFEKAQDKVEAYIKCSKCSQIINEPMTCVPCRHHFCKSCHYQKNKDDEQSKSTICCLLCGPATMVYRNESLDELIQMYSTMKSVKEVMKVYLKEQ